MKALLAVVLAGSVAYADPPGATPPVAPAQPPAVPAQPPAAPAQPPEAPPSPAQPADNVQPPSTQPPSTQPPSTQPPSMQPPSTQPPSQPAPSPMAKPLPPNIERVEPPENARTEAWIATGVTAAIIGMGVYSVVEMREASNTANQYFGMADHYNEWHAAVVDNDKWFHATLLFGGLSVASVAVTGILWSRSQPSFRVAPTPGGGYVGYAGSF